jgi:hypothetical protein
LFDLDPAGGQVVVTRFDCGGLVNLLTLLVLHVRIKRAVRRRAPALIGSRVVVDWRRRVMYSISMWPDLDSVYLMGEVKPHVLAARRPRRMGVRTTCGVFCYAGDWRRVMFRGGSQEPSPFAPMPAGPAGDRL